MWAKDFVSNGNISNIAEEAHPLLINANLWGNSVGARDKHQFIELCTQIWDA